MKPSTRQLPAVFFIPSLFFLLCLFLKFATGPYYLGNNNDPAYLYLINSLYILDGLAPGFIQHPGTTLQILGAVIIRLMSGTVPFGQLVEGVYRNPEFFLHAIYYGVLSMNIVSLVVLGWYVLLKSGRVLWVFLVQSSVLLIASWDFRGIAQGSIPVVANVNAENLLIALTNVYGLLLLKLYFEQKEGSMISSRGLAAAFGFLCATGFVTKTIFLAWAVAPLFLFKGWKERAAFILVFLGSVAMWTIPIWPSMDYFIKWYGMAFTHTGAHGSGKVGIVDFQILGANFLRVLWDNAFFCFVWASVFLKTISSLFNGIRHRPSVGPDDLALRFSFVMCSAVFVTMIFIARQPAGHYIVPTINLFGILCFFACQAWTIKDGVLLRTGLTILVVLNIGLSFDAGAKLARVNTDNYNFSKKVYSEYKDCVVCGFYRSSSPAFALLFGDENQGHLAYVNVLQKVYPNSMFYHYWNHYFYNGRDIVNYEDLNKRSECIMLYGSRLPKDFNRGFVRVREIASSYSEVLYKIERVTATDALKALTISKEFESLHQYANAYAYAREAKDLGLVEIGPYMDDLLKKIIQEP